MSDRVDWPAWLANLRANLSDYPESVPDPRGTGEIAVGYPLGGRGELCAVLTPTDPVIEVLPGIDVNLNELELYEADTGDE